MVPARTTPTGVASPMEMPTVGSMLARVLTLRCPWCGGRKTFVRRWLGRHRRCPTCGLRWRREDGFELGPMTLNIILTFLAVLAAMGIAIGVTLPDIPVTKVVVALAAVAAVVPLIVFPWCNLAWFAVDLRAHPPSATELAEARAVVQERVPGGDP